jgi:hypothetical protein
LPPLSVFEDDFVWRCGQPNLNDTLNRVPGPPQVLSPRLLHTFIEDDISHLVGALSLADRHQMSGIPQRGEYAFPLQIILVHYLLNSHTTAEFAHYEIDGNPSPPNDGLAT